MYAQVELPQPVQIAEVQFESGIVAPENISTVPGAPVRTAIGGGGRWTRRPGRAPRLSAAPAPAARAAKVRGYPARLQGRGGLGRRVDVENGRRGQGHVGTATRISFAPVRARYVKITETADTPDAPPWMIQRFSLL